MSICICDPEDRCIAYNPQTGQIESPDIDVKRTNSGIKTYTMDDHQYILIPYKTHEELHAKICLAKELLKDGKNSLTMVETLLQ